MKILFFLAALILAQDLSAQTEEPRPEREPLYFSLDAGLGPGYDSDLLSLYRFNLGSRDHRFSLGYYCQGEGLDFIDLDWNMGELGSLEYSEPIPDRTTMSDPNEIVVSYGPVLRTGSLSLQPSIGLGVGWQTETHYYDGRRDYYSGRGRFGFGRSVSVYKTRITDHWYVIAPLALTAEIRLFSFMALTGHGFVNVTGPVKHGWAFGLGFGRY